ncbi:GNAT family N-acetyltransferase [Spiroplasma platyhelix]|uniref:GNAT family N-acetyltransferase n=1 Tax=Spiroplasma platyhelix PALS-1 TaxID=1276218 RepID=A0A846U125_9MOLU|nr:GNAT family protein [Spiroplasma platyhelix]MBE4704342.1 hypothetical protein [Spiroplasma platyhelix PALS-1]NKE38714.1 GNAT family N-acetyltransferase [Spiroplasma platyhelix PALS-1]UJB28924.1 ribosomal-protein-alanine N-acetyltransferase [Spiroplasma platyhelix PALS-1]
MTDKEIPTLTSSRLILRALTLNDAESIFEYANNEAVAKYVFWEPHQTIEDSINFVSQINKSDELMWGIQLKDNPKIIGTCGFITYNSITKCLTIGYALNQNYWTKGYTKEALSMLIDYAFNNLDTIRIEGICVVDNIASEKVMLSCNMEFEGILHDNFIKGTDIHDCKLFAITKRNYLANLKK